MERAINESIDITSIKMSELTYDQLSDEEKAAIEYSIVFPHRSLKSVLPKLFTTSWYPGLYARHRKGRKCLKERGFLDDEFNPTDRAFEKLPPKILTKMAKQLNKEIKREHTELNKTTFEKLDLETKYRNLEAKNEELGGIQERFKLISKIVQTFGFLNVDENWVSVLICSNLVEQAMKKKLEELGVELETKPPPSFKYLRNALGNALREKEDRRLDALFEPKEIWRIRNKIDHSGYKLKFNKDKANAIFIMTKEIIDKILLNR